MLLFAALVLTSLAPALGAPFTLDSRNLFESDLLSLDVDGSLRGGASRFSQVAVFGDSLSDGGKGAWLFSNKTWPADPHYYGHRFSNGRVHAEDLASSLGLPILDFAVGGATTNNSLVAGYTGPGSTLGPVPSVLDQVQSFTRSPSLAAKAHSTLFIVYGGANNFFFDPSVTAPDVLRDLKSAVKALRAVGTPLCGRHFLVPSLPPLGHDYPFTTLVPSYAAPLGHFSETLHGLLQEWALEDHLVRSPDYYELFTSIFAKPQKYGFDPEKLGESCLRGVYMEIPGVVTVCEDVDKYVWWDEYHPSARVHGMMGTVALDTVNKRGKGW